MDNVKQDRGIDYVKLHNNEDGGDITGPGAAIMIGKFSFL
jgi:hypothetical protein